MKLIVDSFAVENGFGGGSKRCFNVLRHLPDQGFDIQLYVPLTILTHVLTEDAFEKGKVNIVKDSLKKLESSGIIIPDYVYTVLEDYKWVGKKVTEKDEIECAHKFSSSCCKADIIYSPHESYENCHSALYLSQVLKLPLVVLMQLEPFNKKNKVFKFMPRDYRLELFPVFLYRHYNDWRTGRKNQALYMRMLKTKNLRCLAGVSGAPFIESGLDFLCNLYNVQTRIHENPVAAEGLTKFRSNKKSVEGVCYARLVPEKGIFELPYIWQRVNKAIPGAKLKMFGSFPSRRTKKTFFKIVNKLNLQGNISYNGFVSEEDLRKNVANSKVFIYPTHADAYPLSILESMFVGTSIVTYNIPAIAEVYADLPNVHIVKEFDIEAMANQAISIIKMSDTEYRVGNDNPRVNSFLQLRSNWTNVAIAETKLLLSILGENAVSKQRLK